MSPLNGESETTVRSQNHCSVLLHIPGQWHLILHAHPPPLPFLFRHS